MKTKTNSTQRSPAPEKPAPIYYRRVGWEEAKESEYPLILNGFSGTELDAYIIPVDVTEEEKATMKHIHELREIAWQSALLVEKLREWKPGPLKPLLEALSKIGYRYPDFKGGKRVPTTAVATEANNEIN